MSVKHLKILFSLILSAMLISETVNAFEIDFSRRRKKLDQKSSREPASQNESSSQLGEFFGATSPNQEVVILNTEKGFIPRTVRLEKGKAYTVYVVNVNEKDKNVSFVLDAHAQYHSTYFGKIQMFEIKPKHEGVYSYQCPETSIEGRMVVYTGKAPAVRGLATERE